MNTPLRLILAITIAAGAYNAHAQDTTRKTPATRAVAQPYGYKPAVASPAQPLVIDHSLNGQYNAILKSTYRYQQGPIVTFYKSFTDTINAQKRKVREAEAQLAVQTKTIADLRGDVTSKDQTLSESQSKVNTVSFLGAPVSKGTYNTIMWGLVLILGGSLLAVIFLSASSRREAAYRIKLFDELSAEFQTYKTKANEKEKKLARELQTERNKLDELNGR